MVGRLVRKLPRIMQTEWDRHITEPIIQAQDGTDWSKFTKWLERQKDIALSARLRDVAHQQTPLAANTDKAKGTGSGASTARDKLPFKGENGCWRCGGTGHISRNCTSPGTRQIKTNLLEVESHTTGVKGSTTFSRPTTKEGWKNLFP